MNEITCQFVLYKAGKHNCAKPAADFAQVPGLAPRLACGDHAGTRSPGDLKPERWDPSPVPIDLLPVHLLGRLVHAEMMHLQQLRAELEAVQNNLQATSVRLATATVYQRVRSEGLP